MNSYSSRFVRILQFGNFKKNEFWLESVLSKRILPFITDAYPVKPIASHADLCEVPIFTFEKLEHLIPK